MRPGCERMSFSGHRSYGRGDVGEGGVQVPAGNGRRGVAGDAPDAGDGGVAQHVRRHRQPSAWSGSGRGPLR